MKKFKFNIPKYIAMFPKAQSLNPCNTLMTLSKFSTNTVRSHRRKLQGARGHVPPPIILLGGQCPPPQ